MQVTHQWKPQWMSVEVALLLWKIPWMLVEVVEASMEVSGSFHGSTWKVPLPVEVEASIASINCSFQEHVPWKIP